MLRIEPRVPADWKEYAIEYQYGGSVYAIAVRLDASAETARITLDGRELDDAEIPLVDDGARHDVIVFSPILRSEAHATAGSRPVAEPLD
jgi:cyclic beta-1,2-glucan synthetase